mgnify:CR=1 FL=1
MEMNGVAVDRGADGITGLEHETSGKYALILLVFFLTQKTGYEICRNIRDVVDIPILMVTATIEEIDKVRGLGLGADDYIAKPFSPTELVARVKANISQYERLKAGSQPHAGRSEIRIGNIRLNPMTRMVYVNDEEVACKAKEFDLLCFMMENPEVVFSKDVLYERIWGMDALGDTKTVAVHINRLREKIEKDPAHPTHIQTVWGAGYRFKL